MYCLRRVQATTTSGSQCLNRDDYNYHIKQVHPGVPRLSVCVCELVCVKVIAKG